MNWIVTYRSDNGKQTQMTLEAESREAVFRELAKRGISAVRIEKFVGRRSGKREMPTRFIMRGAVAGVTVVAIALCTWYFIASETGKVERKPEKRQRKTVPIAETISAPAKSAPVEEKAEPPKIDPNARPTKVGEVVNGYVMLPSGRLHRRTGVITNSVASRAKGSYHIFDHASDNEIACYLSMKPGDALVGPARYTGRFKERFLESLKTPIIVTEDDTPEQAQLKRDVIAARLQLKDALDRGEDIEQIMIDTRQELQDLARYKMELRKQFNELRRVEGTTEEDMDTLLEACNKMLESKGIAPMKFGPITRRKLMSEMENNK